MYIQEINLLYQKQLISHHLHKSDRKCQTDGAVAPCAGVRVHVRVRESQTRLPFRVVIRRPWALVRVTAVVFFFPEGLQFAGRGPRASVRERVALLSPNVPS